MSRAQRKIDHINNAIETGQVRAHGFDDVLFVHQSLPNLSINEIQYSTKVGELSLSSPIIINAMTGGGGEQTLKINQELAIISKECNIGLAVGSQMSAIKDPKERSSYQVVRRENPTGVVVANLGSEATVDQALEAIEMIEANALQIHLNVVQELVMPEGDRDFSGALRRIEKVVKRVNIPVIVKEVGYGMSKETAIKLEEVGVSIIDVGGFGGTNFSKIENLRRSRNLGFFDEWGIPTASSIAEVRSVSSSLSIIGSGGIQSALDMIKAIRLGASAVGMAGYLLKMLIDKGLQSTIDEITELHNDIRFIMTALGTRNLDEIKKAPIVVKGDTYHWLLQREINTEYL
ncbi:type 2 isopentenyl-diphosphate Delta-isomerase [Bacillus salitolerans]|uniref:Isopentenyl-diphosphate delta-isomerase n=1 Tax=Bacillus salitolerans TaxID=1437434 RepID=A0ABW4LU11_9BACI